MMDPITHALAVLLLVIVLGATVVRARREADALFGDDEGDA